MNTETTVNAPTGERVDVYEPGPERTVVVATGAPAEASLATAVGLLFGGLVMLGFGIAWALLFYPPASLAAAGIAFAAAFALPAFGAAIREFVNAGRWGRRAW